MTPFPTGALLRDPRSPGQRNIRVVRDDGRRLEVRIDEEVRTLTRSQTSMARWPLPARTAVAVLPEKRGEEPVGGVIESAEPPDADGLFRYRVVQETGPSVVSEKRLLVLKMDPADPLERLEVNEWRGPRRFFARLALLERTTLWAEDTEGIPALLGARIVPLFHQFYAARRVLLDRQPRFLLADEVGLGKTIEAGLVIQSLLAAKPDLKVLVVAPGTTSRQWLAELYSRFGGRVFTHVDAVRYRHGGGDDGPRNAWARRRDALLASELLIVSTALLRNEPAAAKIVLEQPWDLLVVDEGHHVVRAPQLAERLRRVSAAASGCLVLTATPGRGDEAGLLELLRIVSPGTYGSLRSADFTARLEPQRRILDKLRYSEQLFAALLSEDGIGEDDARELAPEWEGCFPRDAFGEDRLAAMKDGDAGAAQELVAYVQEHYRVDRRIIRTRRATLRAFGAEHASRAETRLRYDAGPAEMRSVDHLETLWRTTCAPAVLVALWGRLACTTPAVVARALDARVAALRDGLPSGAFEDPLAADLGPAEEEEAIGSVLRRAPTYAGEEAWLDNALVLARAWSREAAEQGCARFRAVGDWLEARLRTRAEKIVVFTQSREVAQEFAAYLAKRINSSRVALSHFALEDAEIAKVALRFQRDERCSVLVSDELGAEGRNFQFASAVVHLDVPWLAERVEQRVGRLDRIGRDPGRRVESVTVQGPSGVEEALLELQATAFGAHRRSIGGLEYVLPVLQERVRAALVRGPDALRAETAALRAEVERVEREVDDAFTFFLDATRNELERAKALAEVVGTDGTPGANETTPDAAAIQEWCREREIALQRQDAHRWAVTVDPQRVQPPLPGFDTTHWVSKAATFDRNSALEDESAQFLAPGHRFVDALVQDARTTADARASCMFRDLGGQGAGGVFALVVVRVESDPDRLARLSSAGALRRVEQYRPTRWVRVAFELDPQGSAKPAPAKLMDALRADFVPGRDKKAYPDHLAQILDSHPHLFRSIAQAVKLALEDVRDRGLPEFADAAEEAEDHMRGELAYLSARLQQGDECARVELARCEAVIDCIRHPQLELDAVAVIVGRKVS